MRQLLLLRHAKSSWDDAAVPDKDRPLTPRGKRAAAAMREAMRDLGLVPDLILVSTARRTQETLEALEPWDDTPLVEPMDQLYLASAGQLLSSLRAVAETVRSVLVIAHNPGLHDLALELGGHPPPAAAKDAAELLVRGFPTAGLAEFLVSVPWSRLAPGQARLVRFLTPRTLEKPD